MYTNYYIGYTKERKSTILHGSVNNIEHGKTKTAKRHFTTFISLEKVFLNQHRYQFNIKILIW